MCVCVCVCVCVYRLVKCDTCTILVRYVNDGGDNPCVRAGCIWENSESSCQFCCEPKIYLNIRYF